MSTKAISEASHAEGNGTIAGGYLMDEDGKYRDSNEAHDVVEKPTAAISCQHVEGKNTEAHSHFAHAEGWGSKVFAAGAHAEGKNTTVMFNGNYGHAEGVNTTVAANYAHAEGFSSISYNKKEHGTIAGDISVAWESSKFSLALGQSAHTEGTNTLGLGASSHAEGFQTRAIGDHAHSEGSSTIAKGSYSHSEGQYTSATGAYTHAQGFKTEALGKYECVLGKYNDTSIEYYSNKNSVANKYAVVVGNGSKEDEKASDGTIVTKNRSNAHTLDWNGNAWFAGDIYIGSASGKNKDDGSKKLATEEYVTTTTKNYVDSSNFATEEFVNTATKEYVDNNALIIGEQSLTPDEQSQIRSNLGLPEEKHPAWGEVPIAEGEIRTYTFKLVHKGYSDIRTDMSQEEYEIMCNSSDFSGTYYGYRPDSGYTVMFNSPVKKEDFVYDESSHVLTFATNDADLGVSATITFSNRVVNRIPSEYLENNDSVITLLESSYQNPEILYNKPSGVYYLKGYFKLHSTGYRTVFDGRLAHITNAGSTTHMQLFVASTHAIHYYKINSNSYELTRMYFDDVLTAIEDLKNKPTIHSGQDAPDNSLGKAGDIYIMYE
jgi:hypothetical protein